MHLVWLSSASDNEFDLTAAIARNPDIQLTLYILSDPQDGNHVYHMSQLTKASNIVINEITTEQVTEVLNHIRQIDKDLIILRHPTWISTKDKAEEIAQILINEPAVTTTWEWVPNYAMAQMPQLGPWKRIAVTNYQDFERAKLSYPNKHIIYFPFGVVAWTDKELYSKPEYETDLVCDAQPHYECGEYNAAKRLSVNQMIKPAMELPYILALWGNRYGETTIHDWGATDDFRNYHRGYFPTMEYPRIYSSAKLYLGVTWNYGTGGFSIRLARALSCGIATIWQQTQGHDLDILEGVVEWSKNYEDTKNYIDFYMKNDIPRRRLGRYARYWALDHWEWGKQIKRLVKEIQ